MKLKDFIKTVLCDIEGAVNESAFKNHRYTYIDCYGQGPDKGILFDVAITASKEASGNIGAEVFSIGAKAAGKISNEEISRVKFIVKVGQYFPKPKPNEMLEALKKRLEDESRTVK